MAKPPVLSWSELLTLELPEQEWIIDGLIPRGSFSMLFGREKAGKSLLANDMGLCVALDEPFIDRSVKSGPVVFVSAEEHIRDVRSRMKKRVGSRSDVAVYLLQVDGTHDGYVMRIDQGQGVQDIVDVITEYEPALMVFDVLREFHSGKENEADDMAPILQPIRNIAHETNTAIVLVHHASRGGDYRGSTAMGGSVDQLLRFERLGEDDDTEVKGRIKVEGRYGPRTIIQARMGEGLRWEMDGGVMVFPDETARGRIIAVLRQQGMPMTAHEIADAIETQAVKTVQNKISDMMRESRPPLVASGTGRKFDPKRYELAEPTFLHESSWGEANMKEYTNTDVTPFIPDPSGVREPRDLGNNAGSKEPRTYGGGILPDSSRGGLGSRVRREESIVKLDESGKQREQPGMNGKHQDVPDEFPEI
jgi:KaiC/GvpD/RAD55 family RecA-like ATPase